MFQRTSHTSHLKISCDGHDAFKHSAHRDSKDETWATVTPVFAPTQGLLFFSAFTWLKEKFNYLFKFSSLLLPESKQPRVGSVSWTGCNWIKAQLLLMILKTSSSGGFFFSFILLSGCKSNTFKSQFENANFAVIFRYTSTVLQTVHSTGKYYDDMYPDYVTGTPSGECWDEAVTQRPTLPTQTETNVCIWKTKGLNVCLALKCMQIMFCH